MSVPQKNKTVSVGRKRKTAQKLSAAQIADGKHISARLNGMDVGEITRSSYSRKIEHFKSWCENNCAAALLGDKEHVKKLQEEARRNGEHEDYIVVYNFNTVFLEETYYACIHNYLTTYLNPATGMLFGWATYNWSNYSSCLPQVKPTVMLIKHFTSFTVSSQADQDIP